VRRLPWLTTAAAAAAVAAYAIPGGFGLLSYQRDAVLAGEWWRLFTGHLTHASGTHLVWCAAAFLALGAATERELGAKATAGFLAASAACVGAGLFVFLPGLSWYCGLSGLDTALFAGLLWREARAQRLRRDGLTLALALLAAAGLAGKIAVEYAGGQAVFARSPDVPPVPAAHLFGAAAGGLAVVRRRDGTRPG
jgi:rhomboid family GlyGly-CTERM serine protease